jgi:hypothetical protein
MAPPGRARHAKHRVLVPGGRRAHRASPVRTLRPAGILLAAAIGIACGIYDLQTGRSDTMALFLGGAALILGLIVPVGAVPRAIVMGLSIPAVYFVANLLDLTIPYPPMPHYAVSIVALVPALAGTLLGLALRKLLPSGGPPRRTRIQP